MDRSDFSFLAEPLVARGIAVAMPGYSLCPAATLDEVVADARAAFAWLAERADRVHLCGWSAGAHLAAMIVAGGAPGIRSLLALSGIYDLRPLQHVSMNGDLRLDEAAAARNSPLLLRPATTSRISVAAGALETPALRKQSSDFATAWGLSSQEVGAVHHYAIVSELGNERSTLFETLLGQIKETS
jgi:arylformamidase